MKLIYRIKKRFLITSIVAIIYFWGIWASFGLVFGYFLSKYCSGPAERIRGVAPSIKFSLGRYRLHFHHWLLSLSCLIPLKIYGVFDWNSFALWVFGGMALQGVLCYSDWYKIIYKRKDK